MNSRTNTSWVGREKLGRTGSRLGFLISLMLSTLLILTPAVQSQDEPTGRSELLEEIVVTSTQQEQTRKQLPESVTILEEEEIQQQAQYTDDLGDILSKVVPGLGPSSENLTNFGQNLRGRDFLVMIDGVPQNGSLRQASKHLRSLAPEAIERVEVIRGSVATYGFGATGGIVHFITKSGQGIEGTNFRTRARVSGQTEDSESFGWRLYQSVRGSTGAYDYSVNLSTRETGVFYDGDGDIVPPDGLIQGGSLSESEEDNFQTKLGYTPSVGQRISLAINYYERLQDADYRANRTTGRNNPNRKILAVPGRPQGEPPGTENLNMSLDYRIEDVWGGTLESKLFYQDYETIFSYFAGYPTGGGQSRVLTEHTGARLTHNRDVPGWGTWIYGIDFGEEKTTQNLLDGRTRTPEMTEDTLAPFLQIDLPVGENWQLRAGVRHERADIEIPTFQDESLTRPGTVQGGELDYSETLFNAGAVYYLTDRQELYARYSEGFSVADIGRALRGQTSNVSVTSLDPEAQVVENYELGWRSRSEVYSLTAAAFYNTSDLGTTFSGPPNFLLQRREEEVYGLEATVRYNASEQTRLGGTASWQEGKQDTDNDGSLDAYLPTTRIAPPALKGYLEHTINEQLAGRVQTQYLFDRTRLGDAGYPNGDFNGFGLVDVSLEGNHGPGTWTLAVDNLLDKQYIVPVAQAFNLSSRMVAGRGRSVSLEYSVEF